MKNKASLANLGAALIAGVLVGASYPAAAAIAQPAPAPSATLLDPDGVPLPTPVDQAQVRVGGQLVQAYGADDHNGDHGEHAGAHDAHHGHHDPSLHFNWFSGGVFGYKKLDAEGGPLGDGKMGDGSHQRPLGEGEKETPMSAPFIFALINFAVLLWILATKAWPIVQNLAADRSDNIKTALDEARLLREAAQAKLAEYDAKLAKSTAEMDQMVADMKADAEAEKRRILAAADEQAAAMKKDVENRIAAEVERARVALQREVTLAAANAAETVIKSAASANDQAVLVAQFQKDLDAALAAKAAGGGAGNAGNHAGRPS